MAKPRKTILSKSTSVRFPESWIQDLDKIASEKDMSRNRLIREFIRDGMKRFKSQKSLERKVETSSI